MDVFERARKVNAEQRLDGDPVNASRALLLRKIEESKPARAMGGRRSTVILTSAAAAVALLVTGVTVVARVSTPAPEVAAVPTTTASPAPEATPSPTTEPGPSSTAGATEAEPFPGTTPRPDQSLLIEETDERLLYEDPNATFYQWSFRPSTMPTTAMVVRAHSTLRVPGDRTGEWVSHSGPGDERVEIFPDNADSQRVWDALLPYRAEIYESRYLGGFGDEDGVKGSADRYAQFPDNPQELTQYFHDRFVSQGVEPEVAAEMTVGAIVDELLTNYATAGIRENFAQALASTGRVEKISTDGNIVVYQIRYQVYGEPSTTTVSIDSNTGWVTEYTNRVDRDPGAGDIAPSETPDIRKTFTVTVVDSAHVGSRT